MEIVNKIKEKQNDLYSRKPITIAFLGDSVTQGCFECFEPIPGTIDTVFEMENSYCEIVKRMLNKLYPTVSFTIVNAGISGGSVWTGLNRIDRDVLSFNPDLVVVCFGLNDSGDGLNGIDNYKRHLNNIFKKINSSGAECIFMTPNTMNFIVSPKLKSDFFKDLATDFMRRMNDGVMDEYVKASIEVANDNNVEVCDCYKVWKQMEQSGVNTTELLANKLNHPIKEMHYLFAYELVKSMFK